MNDSRHYIGTPNGVVLCVDEWDGSQLKGRLYHFYQTEATAVSSIEQLFRVMEAFFNELGFPHPEFDDRSFQRETTASSRQEFPPSVLTAEQLLEKYGRLCTVILRVEHRQHSSWQGRMTWVELNRTRHFHSEMELLNLLQSAMTASVEQEKWTREEMK